MSFKKKFKKNKGITLIALVVTIIVLIILAGISIAMLTGQNGILNRATEAKNATETTTNLIFKSDAYLLASRSMRINYYESVHFGIGIVYNTCVNTAGGSGINSPGGRCTCIWGFRPVISLRSDLPNVVE